MEHLLGRSVGRYELISLLGKGRLGSVFRGRDPVLQRDVAIKVVESQFFRGPDLERLFFSVARAAARLEHPGIIKVYDFGQDQGLAYIVMELISNPGDNLRELLQNLRQTNRQLVLPEAVLIVYQVCLALDHATQTGHQLDIKPENVMFKLRRTNGLPYQPIITDLGLSKLARDDPAAQAEYAAASAARVSSEERLHGETDARSDVLCLGLLLYELLAGQLPVEAWSCREAVTSLVRQHLPALRSFHPRMSAQLGSIIFKALQEHPDDGFPDARALAESLRNLILDEAQHVALSPPLAGQVSLLALFEQSPAERAQVGDLHSQDYVQVVSPDGSTRSVPIGRGELNIGRAADNDLVPTQVGISRHHARVDHDGLNYRVTDLNSTNGTFMGNSRLLPGVPEVWTPDKALRIGGLHLRLLPNMSHALEVPLAAEDHTSWFRSDSASHSARAAVAPEASIRSAEESQRRVEVVELRLDVALPGRVRLGRPFDLVVAVRQPASPVLDEEGLDKVRSGDLQVPWAEVDPYNRLRVQVVAPECDVHGADSHTFRLYRGHDSPKVFFQLTPRELGQIGVSVTVYMEEDWLGGARVQTKVRRMVVGRVHTSTTSQPIGEQYLSEEERRGFLEEELTQHERNWALLHTKKAVYAAGEEPLSLLNQIEHERREIARVRAELQDTGS